MTTPADSPRSGRPSGPDVAGALRSELDAALRALEAGFHVQVISTFGDDLVCAPADVNAVRWLDENGADFDQFPVKRGDETVGVLHRSECVDGTSVADAMQPLREGLLVSAHMPITELIPQLRNSTYRLVLRGGNIDGLVTQSDLLKLPVRLVFFALLTHLEQVMANLIDAHWPEDGWFELLGEGRREKIGTKREYLRNRKLNPPMLELTEFADKRTLSGSLVGTSRTQFLKELEGLQNLRDQLAHAATFVDVSVGQPAVTELVTKFENARRWIDELTEMTARFRGGE